MLASKIKILIVSRTPWNEANSFGNTFSNLFEGMTEVEIANICCQGGSMNSRLIDESFQITDKDVAKSIFGFRPGRLIHNGLQEISSSTPNIPRKSLFYLIREAIWVVGKWKTKALKRFISDFNPDILYLPIYRSHYMCKIDKYVIRVSGAPYVVHISDDVYGYPPAVSGLSKQLQRIIRKDIRQIFKDAAYGEVFSPVMSEEYHREFNIPFHVIGKSVDISNTPVIPVKKREKPIRFVYTGNYGGERGGQLVSLARSITEVFPSNEAVLDIYSATKADLETESQLKDIACVNLMGAISPNKILNIQQNADYLIHVEGFSPKAVYESRLSFSTKIIDYLLAGRPIFAIGPEEVTSIHVLKKNGIAHVAVSPDETKELLTLIAQGYTNDDSIVENGRNYLLIHRDALKMKTEMLGRLQRHAKQ